MAKRIFNLKFRKLSKGHTPEPLSTFTKECNQIGVSMTELALNGETPDSFKSILEQKYQVALAISYFRSEVQYNVDNNISVAVEFD